MNATSPIATHDTRATLDTDEFDARILRERHRQSRLVARTPETFEAPRRKQRTEGSWKRWLPTAIVGAMMLALTAGGVAAAVESHHAKQDRTEQVAPAPTTADSAASISGPAAS